MAKRKPITYKMRFEVFKRDKFTCQYCGKSAPDTILEVDHIKPVSKGGTNDMLNLVTSCRECNRGKTNTELSDDTTVKKQQKQLQELAEKKEQLEMLLEWRSGLMEIENEYVDAVVNDIEEKTGACITESGRIKIGNWLKKYSLVEILDACDISFERYYNGTDEGNEEVFRKIPGICYIRKYGNDNPFYYYVNYICKALKNNHFYFNRVNVKNLVIDCVHTDEDFEIVKKCLVESRNWTNFKNLVYDALILSGVDMDETNKESC